MLFKDLWTWSGGKAQEFELSLKMTTVQFRYEMRRECQEILPGLLLGPFVASKSIETLTDLKVSHMYVVGSHLRNL